MSRNQYYGNLQTSEQWQQVVNNVSCQYVDWIYYGSSYDEITGGHLNGEVYLYALHGKKKCNKENKICIKGFFLHRKIF